MHRPLLPLVFTATLAAAALAACGGDDSPATDATKASASTSSSPSGSTSGSPSGSTAPGTTSAKDDGGPVTAPPSGGGGTCGVKVTGDVQASWTGSGGSAAVGTDYWYTESELDKVLSVLATTSTTMANQPKLYILILNCSGSSAQSLSLLPSNNSTYADIPFGPGTYPIAAGGPLGASDPVPGQFSALLGLGEDQGFYGVPDPGTLEITKWDTSGIAGTFSFKGTEGLAATPRHIEVTGSFDFECTGPSICT